MKKISILAAIALSIQLFIFFNLKKNEDHMPIAIIIAITVNCYLVAMTIHFINLICDRRKSQKRKNNSKF